MSIVLAYQLDGLPREYHLTAAAGLGRAPDNEIVLPASDVSRHHARLEPDENGAWVHDLGSANGTLVNGVGVAPRAPQRLGDGDRVGIGPYVFDVKLASDSAASATATVVPTQVEETVGPGAHPIARVVIHTPGGAREFRLGASELSVGRGPWNDIIIDQGYVSQVHAMLKRTSKGYVIEDAGSTNGLEVDKKRVSTWLLRDGDTVAIGNSVILRYIESFAPEEPPRDLELNTRPAVVIGRDPGCDVTLPHPTVSRMHARVTNRGEDGRTVEDLGSTNGTFVNGDRLPPREPRPLIHGDILQIGPVALTID
jgi:pSer/pThr/pTyr-binding forkhead associated (FHA) protein